MVERCPLPTEPNERSAAWPTPAAPYDRSGTGGAPLAEPTIEQLASSLELVSLPVGALVFSQGDPGDGFYVVEVGTVEIVINEVLVNTIDRGRYFGEIALLHDVPRTAPSAHSQTSNCGDSTALRSSRR
jgi:CRP-like cAMP-binding protein